MNLCVVASELQRGFKFLYCFHIFLLRKKKNAERVMGLSIRVLFGVLDQAVFNPPQPVLLAQLGRAPQLRQWRVIKTGNSCFCRPLSLVN